jgi:phosphohistidine phosphatase SixA
MKVLIFRHGPPKRYTATTLIGTEEDSRSAAQGHANAHSNGATKLYPVIHPERAEATMSLRDEIAAWRRRDGFDPATQDMDHANLVFDDVTKDEVLRNNTLLNFDAISRQGTGGAKALAMHLVQQDCVPDIIITSQKGRAVNTAMLLKTALERILSDRGEPRSIRIVYSEKAGPGKGALEIWESIAAHTGRKPDSNVAVISHDTSIAQSAALGAGPAAPPEDELLHYPPTMGGYMLEIETAPGGALSVHTDDPKDPMKLKLDGVVKRRISVPFSWHTVMADKLAAMEKIVRSHPRDRGVADTLHDLQKLLRKCAGDGYDAEETLLKALYNKGDSLPRLHRLVNDLRATRVMVATLNVEKCNSAARDALVELGGKEAALHYLNCVDEVVELDCFNAYSRIHAMHEGHKVPPAPTTHALRVLNEDQAEGPHRIAM